MLQANHSPGSVSSNHINAAAISTETLVFIALSSSKPSVNLSMYFHEQPTKKSGYGIYNSVFNASASNKYIYRLFNTANSVTRVYNDRV